MNQNIRLFDRFCLIALVCVGLLALAAPGLAQTPPAGLPDQAAKPVKPPESTNDDPCHGPYVKKLIARDREAKEAEIDQRKVRDFFNDVGQTLESARRAEEKQLAADRLAVYKKCLADRQRPSMLCTVMSRRNAQLCSELIAKEDRTACFQLLTIGNAGAARDPKLCEVLEHNEILAICRFVATRQFECSGLTVPEYQAVCNAMADGLEGKTLPSGLGPAEKTGLFWLLAMIENKAGLCEEIPDPREADGCRAAVARDPASCPKVRPTIEFLDNDYSCRDVLMYQKLHKRAQGSQLVLLLGTPFRGNASCTVKLHIKAQGQPLFRNLAPVVLGAERVWHELHYRLGDETLHHVDVNCDWDPASSRYVLESDRQNDW